MDIERLIALVVLSAAAVTVALALQRRRPEPPTAPSYRAPGQVDRADFVLPGAERLVAVFSSSTCDGCATVWEMVEPLATDRVAVQQIEVQTDKDLHKRYKIDGVPTTLVIDESGVVVEAFFGAMPFDELRSAINR